MNTDKFLESLESEEEELGEDSLFTDFSISSMSQIDTLCSVKDYTENKFFPFFINNGRGKPGTDSFNHYKLLSILFKWFEDIIDKFDNRSGRQPARRPCTIEEKNEILKETTDILLNVSIRIMKKNNIKIESDIKTDMKYLQLIGICALLIVLFQHPNLKFFNFLFRKEKTVSNYIKYITADAYTEFQAHFVFNYMLSIGMGYTGDKNTISIKTIVSDQLCEYPFTEEEMPNLYNITLPSNYDNYENRRFSDALGLNILVPNYILYTQPGQRPEHYTIEDEIAHGSFGIVYLYSSGSNKLALKLSKDFEESIIIDYLNTKNIKCGNVPACNLQLPVNIASHLGDDNDLYYIVMKYIENDFSKLQGKLSEKKSFEIVKITARYLQCLYKNDLSYYDVKIANSLFLCQKKHRIEIYLGDLGSLAPGNYSTGATYPPPEYCDEPAYTKGGEKSMIWILGIFALLLRDPYQKYPTLANKYGNLTLAEVFSHYGECKYVNDQDMFENYINHVVNFLYPIPSQKGKTETQRKNFKYLKKINKTIFNCLQIDPDQRTTFNEIINLKN